MPNAFEEANRLAQPLLWQVIFMGGILLDLFIQMRDFFILGANGVFINKERMITDVTNCRLVLEDDDKREK